MGIAEIIITAVVAPTVVAFVREWLIPFLNEKTRPHHEVERLASQAKKIVAKAKKIENKTKLPKVSDKPYKPKPSPIREISEDDETGGRN